MDEIAVIVSGYFNPLHKGHIEYLNQSKKLGDRLMVIINNDDQVKLKGSKVFQDVFERHCIISNLKCVDATFISIDYDRSVCNTIEFIHDNLQGYFKNMLFANGGDQTLETIAESKICERLGIKLVNGLGNKIQSSSWLKDPLNG